MPTLWRSCAVTRETMWLSCSPVEWSWWPPSLAVSTLVSLALKGHVPSLTQFPPPLLLLLPLYSPLPPSPLCVPSAGVVPVTIRPPQVNNLPASLPTIKLTLEISNSCAFLTTHNIARILKSKVHVRSILTHRISSFPPFIDLISSFRCLISLSLPGGSCPPGPQVHSSHHRDGRHTAEEAGEAIQGPNV